LNGYKQVLLSSHIFQEIYRRHLVENEDYVPLAQQLVLKRDRKQPQSGKYSEEDWNSMSFAMVITTLLLTNTLQETSLLNCCETYSKIEVFHSFQNQNGTYFYAAPAMKSAMLQFFLTK
jgi:hypothetical protein